MFSAVLNRAQSRTATVRVHSSRKFDVKREVGFAADRWHKGCGKSSVYAGL